MSELTRRSFLRGALTLMALAIAPAAVTPAYPVIIGDGVHDDTDGLQAAFDGKPFICEGQFIEEAKHLHLSGGKFKITRQLIVRQKGTRVNGGTFYCHEIKDATLIPFDIRDSAEGCGFENMFFDHRAPVDRTPLPIYGSEALVSAHVVSFNGRS